jgi:hypothetical protein
MHAFIQAKCEYFPSIILGEKERNKKNTKIALYI